MTAAIGQDPAELPHDSGLALLTGDGASELMSAVLAAAGGRLLHWRTSQVDHQPGIRTTVSYSARVRWSDGSTGVETLGATDGRLPDGVVKLSDGETEIGMWRFPFDPDLPALPAACDAARMRRLATGVGLGGPVRLRVRTYRPRRRAVVEVAAAGGTTFVKVIEPRKARPLHQRHRVAVAAGCPVPESLGWTDDGLLVPEGPEVPVHGDFYESQLMIRAGRVAGLLDIDTAGLGERLDDAACLLGHPGVLAQLQSSRAGLINCFALRLQRRFEREAEAAVLRRRTAAVVLSLAPGPHRVQQRGWRANTGHRLALAERWLDHADSTRSARG